MVSLQRHFLSGNFLTIGMKYDNFIGLEMDEDHIRKVEALWKIARSELVL
jgi:hypothetical protein